MEQVKRNRAKTTQRIVEALEEVINERGLDKTGINDIAAKAGISKVLIYRYFGGLNGLIDYYVRMGKLFPVFTPAVLDQIRPLHESDVSRIWYRQVIQTYRSFRMFKASRELLKATIVENDVTADVTSKALDEEMTRLVEQLAFVQGADTKAISAVVLGAMSYLTIMAQNDRTMIGLDLRSEDGWQRIEAAVKMIYQALNKMAVDSPTTKITTPVQTRGLSVGDWSN